MKNECNFFIFIVDSGQTPILLPPPLQAPSREPVARLEQVVSGGRAGTFRAQCAHSQRKTAAPSKGNAHFFPSGHGHDRQGPGLALNAG